MICGWDCLEIIPIIWLLTSLLVQIAIIIKRKVKEILSYILKYGKETESLKTEFTRAMISRKAVGGGNFSQVSVNVRLNKSSDKVMH